MTKSEYEEIIDSLKKKLKNGCMTNRDDGYNQGILAAISKVRSVYLRNREDKK